MAKKELVSFCKPEETPPFGGTIHFKNPRYFYEHESIPAYCTHFFTDNEKIRKAYLAAGKIEHGKGYTVQKEEVVSKEADNHEVSDVEDSGISVDVEEMSWPELRSYAATLTDEPIKNKAMALEVIANNS
ncbi:hypothetical protein [Sinomicrobium sp.]